MQYIHAVMCSVYNLVLIYRAWKNKLRTVKPENQVEMYQTLSVLAKETDAALFHQRLSSFILLWTPIEPEFMTYFSKYYEKRAGNLLKGV